MISLEKSSNSLSTLKRQNRQKKLSTHYSITGEKLSEKEFKRRASKVKWMTIAQIQQELGYVIKVVK